LWTETFVGTAKDALLMGSVPIASTVVLPASSGESPKSRADIDAQLSQHIVEAEAHLKVVYAQLVAVVGTDADIRDVEKRIVEALDTLQTLRSELWDLRMKED